VRLQRLILVALVFCLLQPGTSSAQTTERDQLPGILGKDDRVILDNQDYPWSAVGRLNRGGRGFCTGSLVGHDIVLTAAHCLYDRRTGRRLRPNELVFLAGYRRGNYLALGRVQRIIEPPEFSTTRRAGIQQVAHDWALLLLTRKLPLRPLPVHTLKATPLGITVGYSQDRAHLLSRDSNCQLTPAASHKNIIEHSCDATRGASGSPLMIESAHGYALVGVVVGAVDTKRNEKGLAVAASAFTRSLNDLRHRQR